jgi:prephenate dehydrogenase
VTMRVALLGTGLIGGSIGLALRRLPEVEAVVAYDIDPGVAQRALERGAATATAGTPEEAVEGADVVFIAAPVRTIPELAARAITRLKPGAVITDVGSTKSRVVVEIEKSLPHGKTFIGGHPMAGTEHDGIDASEASLFDGSWWILTPTERVEAASYRFLHTLLGQLGAQVMALDPARHDELMAVISHLPHLTATTLMNLAGERGKEHAGLLSLAAGGFRDVTRVAASNPDIWLDICEENSEAISAVIRNFSDRLLELGELVRAGKRSDLRERFLAAREARRDLPGKRVSGELFELHIPIPDRPGVLAEVTTTVGNLGVNIEDLQISHAEEGGRGVLRLLVVGADEAAKVEAALVTHGYDVRSLSL